MSAQHVYAVLIHGWAGSPRVWNFVPWSQDWTVLPYTLPGHDERRDEGPCTIPSAGEDLAAFIRCNVPSGEQVLLIGHSMGGQLTLCVHTHYPQLVAGEVVLDPALGVSEEEVAGQSAMLDNLRRDAYATIESFIHGAFSRFTSDKAKTVIMKDIRIVGLMRRLSLTTINLNILNIWTQIRSVTERQPSNWDASGPSPR